MSLIPTLKYILNHPLNRDHKSQALVRFAKWQIGSRMVPGPVIFEWISGARVVVRPGETGLTQNIYCGLHDFRDMSYLLHAMSPQDLFVDVGANVGSYTILACGVRGGRGYCFEPVPTTYRRLLDNITLNGLSSRVAALNIGVSDRDGELAFSTDQNCTNHVLAAEEEGIGSTRVPVRTLDSVLPAECPFLMKIDVEGFETPVLDGAVAILENPSLQSIIMELNGSGTRYGYDDEQILRKVRRFGFAPHEYDPFRRKLRPLTGKETSEGNTLFIRNPGEMEKRLRDAPPIRLGTMEI